MKPVAYDDLYEFHFISDAKLSPDGANAIFMEYQADKEKNAYEARLWLQPVAMEGQRLLVERGGVKLAQWLDERQVIFASERQPVQRPGGKHASGSAPENGFLPEQAAGTVSAGSNETGGTDAPASVTGSRATHIYKIPIDGGEASYYMSVPEKVNSIRPLGGGRFLISVYSGELSKTDDSFFIADELPFWYNGKGVVNKKRMRLYIGTKEGESCRLKAVTEALTDVLSFDVSPDGTKLAWSGRTFKDMSGLSSDLWLYDIVSGTGRCLAEGGGSEIYGLVFMGNDRLFYQKQPYEWAGRNPRFFIVSLKDGQTSLLPFYDRAVGNSVGTDAKYGGGQSAVFDNGRLYYLEAGACETQIAVMDDNGNRACLNHMPGAVTGIDAKNGRLIMTAMRGNKLAEVYAVDPADGAETQLSHFNDEWLAGHDVGTPECFTYHSANGYDMKGFVLKPVDFDPDRKYPVILSMHGGPKVTFGTVFHHEMQCQAGGGYFVIYTNPRGSDGRGEAFADLTGSLGGPDYDDFMEFVDEAVRRYPQMDTEHMGICGGSYGGFMCNWMIGHTDRFAAAVSQRSISNYMTKLLCTDIGFYHNKLQIGVYPWEDVHKLWAHSPLASAANVKTPTLFIQSDEDYRCYMSDAIQMFSALKRNGVDTRMVLFHGENHELSRSGKPQNRIKRLEEMGAWFEKYLKI